MFWICLFLGILFLTPFGWIGMMSFGGAVAVMMQSSDDPYNEYKNRVQREYLNKVNDVLSESESIEEARIKIDGI